MIMIYHVQPPPSWNLPWHCYARGVLSAGAAAARQVPRRARVSTRRTRPSSGWKLLKKLPLLQLPQPVLPTVLVQPDEPVTLVDCGSGSTRALFYRDDGMSHVSWEKSTWRGGSILLKSFGPENCPQWFCRWWSYAKLALNVFMQCYFLALHLLPCFYGFHTHVQHSDAFWC